MSLKLRCRHCGEVREYIKKEIIGKSIIVLRNSQQADSNSSGSVVVTCKACGKGFKVPKNKIL